MPPNHDGDSAGSSDDEVPLAFAKTRRVPKKRRTSNSPEYAAAAPRLKRARSKPENKIAVVRDLPASASSSIAPAPSLRRSSSSKTPKAKREVKLEPLPADSKKKSKKSKDEKDEKESGYRWWDEGEGGEKRLKWTSLSHNAVIFPPEYEPHGMPFLYNGEPVELTDHSEEIATFFASKLATDYVKKPVFKRNFFEDFRKSLRGSPAAKVVKKLDKCDFSRIFEDLEKKKQEKKDVPAAERKTMREEETERTKKYTVAIVDGREEKIGNFRVEPPGLFLGRGEHPKMGKVKSRIYPEDITINIGREGPVPECLLEGHNWGKIVHKQDVTWLCYWKDTITGGSKYVWLAAGSAFKGMSDHAKFEKARRLKQYIEQIRHDYKEGWKAKSKEVRQRSVAMYLIDKLALRVGNEKGDEEADTVGCCSLRVEHVKFVPPRTVEFDFLGKDSIRYFNSVEVKKLVFDNLQLFCRGKQGNDEIFHRLTVTGLNDYLKSLMDGLSAKVFRTFNASQTLDQLLSETANRNDLNENVVFYNQQNKEVAILCNHQRALPKAHGAQMEKMDRRLSNTEDWLKELQRGKRVLQNPKGKVETVELKQFVPEKPEFTEDMNEKARAAERKRAAEAPYQEAMRSKKLPMVESEIKRVKERLAKLKADMQVKDDLKTVALGTSKINYLDPRITVAWCKKHEVPIEKIFAKTLLTKFAWAMETDEDFRF